MIIHVQSLDSVSNSLNAIIKMATPSGYLVEHKISILGSKFKRYSIFFHVQSLRGTPFFVIIIHQLHMLVGIAQDDSSSKFNERDSRTQ